MRRLDFTTVRKHAAANAVQIRLAAGMDSKKNQPHDDEQWAALSKANAERRKRWKESGKLEFTGPRSAIMRMIRG